MSTSKAIKSKEFFDDPNNYIKSNVIIELRRKIIKDYLGNIKDKEILDLGCGNGELTKDFAKNNKITYLDISPNMIELAKKNIEKNDLVNCNFNIGDINTFDFKNKFDIIICVGVIAHVENISFLITRLKEFSKENTTFILQYTANDKFLAKFNRIKASILKSDNYNYNINYSTSHGINKLINEHQLIKELEVNYIPISPLLSIFNYKSKKYILFRLIYSKLFKWIGSEIILVLKRK